MIDGTPILHTLSLYVQRDPMGEDEKLKVSTVAGERKVAKAAKETA